MPNPTRDTTSGRIYNDLRNLARRNGAPTDQVMLEYLLERFLYRVSVHPLGGQPLISTPLVRVSSKQIGPGRRLARLAQTK